MNYRVVDNEFNRANYAQLIGQQFAVPPAYVQVEEVPSVRDIYYRMAAMSQDELKKFVAEHNHPTCDATAEALWHLLSGNHGPFDNATASRLYTEMGYKPFCGLPLQRA